MKKIIESNTVLIENIIKNNIHLDFVDIEIKKNLIQDLSVYQIKNEVACTRDLINYLFDNLIKEELSLFLRDSCTSYHMIPEIIEQSKSFHLKNFTNHI